MLRKIISERNIKIAIGLPTMNSQGYIYNSLKKLQQELVLIPPNIKTSLVICLNGTNDNNATLNEIHKFTQENKQFQINTIIRPQPGKNEAVNAIIDFNKKNGIDITHLVDDDVSFTTGSISNNVKLLVLEQAKTKEPVMVGSHMKAYQYTLKDYLLQEKSWVSALKKCFWHNVFRLPFDDQSEEWPFNSAQSLAMYTNNFITLPPSNSGSVDDITLNYDIAARGKLLKTEGSEVFFKVAEDKKERENQQLRNLFGVLHSKAQFTKDTDKILKTLSWSYTTDPKMYKLPPKMGLSRLFFYLIHMYYRYQDARNANQHFTNNIVPNWGTASSTKPLDNINTVDPILVKSNTADRKYSNTALQAQ
ncbi:MAG: hypothetical protein A2Y40_04855 [Candidatus Margulisbacteria bacterium GWF2_35_9]|nr:MAG: hypothetical protein A2Y40_04855 [Candidatus Margulisbacteria bacterium GWF2_35_9]